MGVLFTNPQATWEVPRWDLRRRELCHQSLGSQCTGTDSGLRKAEGEDVRQSRLGMAGSRGWAGGEEGVAPALGAISSGGTRKLGNRGG